MNPIAPSLFDLNGLTALKQQARANDPKALRATAQQFEALFLQMLLKSMRDATPKEGLFDSEQTRMYESLLDQQLSQVMAGKGGTGLAAVIEKQLSRGSEDPVAVEAGLPLNPSVPPRSLRPLPPAVPLAPNAAATAPSAANGAASAVPAATTELSPAARQFVGRVWSHAVDAGTKTGIPPAFLVAQAALETGWGRSEPTTADGRPSFNLFGVKAGRSWTGPVVEATTTEYVDGAPQRRVERFRAYGSYAEAFQDYARLLSSNPRYAGVVGAADAAGFARGLQQAGYATDPGYADKLTRIIGGQTLRIALAA